MDYRAMKRIGEVLLCMQILQEWFHCEFLAIILVRHSEKSVIDLRDSVGNK